jgi:ACR3 family arsenite efflux pump ArsB
MFYLLATISIMNGLHASRQLNGAPSLALLLAPPSVGFVALDALKGDITMFSTAASMVLGWILILFLLFAKIGPVFFHEPGVLGGYCWAYVSPLCAVATVWIRLATVVDNTTATVVAAFFTSIAIIALFAVITRMIVHCVQCSRAQAQWGDPLLMSPSHVDHRIAPGQATISGNVV